MQVAEKVWNRVKYDIILDFERLTLTAFKHASQKWEKGW